MLARSAATDRGPIEAPAPTYRVFYLDAGARVHSSRTIWAASDEEARMIARTLANSHGVELWECARRLGHYPARGATSAGRH